jgi:predicted CopG family antitoxin
MGFKTITIREDVYKELLTIKRENESFSDLFKRLAKKNLAILKELKGSMEFKSKEKMIKGIYKKREEKRYQ